jgi:hypothetical protein
MNRGKGLGSRQQATKRGLIQAHFHSFKVSSQNMLHVPSVPIWLAMMLSITAATDEGLFCDVMCAKDAFGCVGPSRGALLSSEKTKLGKNEDLQRRNLYSARILALNVLHNDTWPRPAMNLTKHG